MSHQRKWVVSIWVALLIALPLFSACGNESGKKTSLTASPLLSPNETVTGPWPDAVVQVKQGMIKGFADDAETLVWKAIPYAKPPVGDLRWKAPEEAESWEGTRETKEFCTPCTQYQPSVRAASQGPLIGNEDCLYLNVWRPDTNDTGLPVYVWIHGGGNSIGAAVQGPWDYGDEIARRANAVFVSTNYRLGPMGWFAHSALKSGDPLDDSGNYGNLDIIQALRWVRENIEAFGGDPGNVTIAGLSAGAMNVFTLMLSPVAEGLFHKAVAQSGRLTTMPVSMGEASARGVLLDLLMNDGTAGDRDGAEAHAADMSDAEIAAYLRSKSTAEIYACYRGSALGFGMISFPFFFEDGAVIPSGGFEAFETGSYPNKVPIIIGSAKEEVKTFLFMTPRFTFEDEHNDRLYEIIASYGSDLWKAEGVDEVACALSSHPNQPTVYVYQFLWGASSDGKASPIPGRVGFKLGAGHGMDTAFFFGKAADTRNPLTAFVTTTENLPGREALSHAMMDYVAQFLRTGDPDTPVSGLPTWQGWMNEPDKPKCILFDAEGELPRITMSSMELTEAGIWERMKAEVPEPFYSEAMGFFEQWFEID
ncbi:MAG: carboxylesterase family protein [Chloroflexi bacterium]|nr:carboxylesterase family protein [Chloroflexota bacterium]